jgi:hypothetical protein
VFAPAIRTRKECVLSIERNRADRSLDDVAVDLDAAVIDEADQAGPAREGIADRFGELGLLADKRQLGAQPDFQVVDDRLGLLLPDRSPLLGGTAADRALDCIEPCNALQRLARDRRRAGRGQLVEASADVRPAECELDVAALGKRPITGVTIDLEDALEPGQMGARPFCPPRQRLRSNSFRAATVSPSQ